MGRKMKLRIAFFLIVLLLIAVAAGAWYFKIYTKTPEYAMKQIEASLVQHDGKLFHRYVDMDALLDNSYDEFLEGLMGVDQALTEDAKGAVGNFAQMMKRPLLLSFHTAVDQYVETGTWSAGEDGKNEYEQMGDSEFLMRSGLQKMEFRGLDGIEEDSDTGRAVANTRVYQKDAQEEFVFEVMLKKAENGDWRVEEIRNLEDFMKLVGRARQKEMEKYLEDTAAIITKHERIIRDAEMKYGDILSAGSLGNPVTREEIRKLMKDVIQKDWEERKQELFMVSVPVSAQTLQHLRMRICDLYIDYAKGYAEWMLDKKAVTVRDADAKLKQAKTLEQEERALMRNVRADAVQKEKP